MELVLIVDDDPMVLNALSSTLGKAFSSQFKIITAQNGREAVQVLEKAQISLLITDLVMPEIDGFQLLALVSERYPSLPCFVMSSAYDDPEIRCRIPQDNLKFYTKPIHPKTVGPEILKAINASAKQKEAKGISVINFLLMIEMEMRTCLFEAVLPNGKKSIFYFKKGVLYQAVYENLRGEEAVIAVIAQGKALFNFKPLPSKPIPRKIDKTLENMVSETLKQYVDKKDSAPVQTVECPPDTPEERLSLPGKMILDNGVKKTITVTNIARSEIQFKTVAQHNLTQGSVVTLEFALDDKLSSPISRKVTATDIQNKTILADFPDRNHYDRLGPYIAFNGFSKDRIS